MHQTATSGNDSAAASAPMAKHRKTLHWRRNDRMGGKVPVWEGADSARTAVSATLSGAAGAAATQNFKQAMAYAAAPENRAAGGGEPFGFGDLIDMVNPLQQLPIVGNIYREITGDRIRPISKIIGGGIFGGPAGAAAGLVNAVSEYETGRGVAGNVVALVMDGEKPEYRSERLGPAKQINDAVDRLEKGEPDLPGNMIGFTDLGYGKRAVYERFPAAEGRTAGTMIRRHEEVSAPNPAREPITQLNLDPMPLLNRDN